MSQSEVICDNPLTNNTEEVCERTNMWSDPHRDFSGTDTPAGTAEDWNARAVFATGPHIASLRGDAQSYDSVRPTGAITLPPTIPTKGVLPITATFSEPINPNFPPNITITNGENVTTATMVRSSDNTKYMYGHLLDGERGTVHLSFSNARDMFGNMIVKTPTSNATFSVRASHAPVQDAAPAGSVDSVAFNFQEPLASSWTLSGDDDWSHTSSLEKGVPDEPIKTNRVISSNECEDSCYITLKNTLNTTKPLTISFDRYVDAKIDSDEGLYVEYSIDGTTWQTLASYTHDNGNDADRWEKSVLGLSIPENSAHLRFHAESNRGDEIVSVDNLAIFRPADAVPDVSIDAILDKTRTSISLVLSHANRMHSFSPSDFASSHGGAISSVSATLNSAAIPIKMSEAIPYDTPVTITYNGPILDFGGGAYLNLGTSATLAPVPNPDKTSDIKPAVIPDVTILQGATATRIITVSDYDRAAVSLSSDSPAFAVISGLDDNGSATITIKPKK